MVYRRRVTGLHKVKPIWWRVFGWFSIIMLLGVGGCQEKQVIDPADNLAGAKGVDSLIQTLADRSVEDQERIDADRQLSRMGGKVENRRSAILEMIVYQRGQSVEMRKYAVDKLRELDPRALERVCYLHLQQIHDLETLGYVTGWIEQELPSHPRLADALIRSLSRNRLEPPVDRKDRPELKALLAGRGVELGQVLWERYWESREQEARANCLELLWDSEGEGKLRARILGKDAKGIEQDDVVGQRLVEWVKAGGAVPRTAQEMIWISLLLDPGYRGWLEEARRGMMDESGKVGAFQVDWVAVLHAGGKRWVGVSEEEIYRQVVERLARVDGKPAKLALRVPRYPGAVDDRDESISSEANKKRLGRGDLIAIWQLRQSLENGEFRRELLKLGKEDLADKQTEHGGLLVYRTGEQIWPVITAPERVEADTAYYATDQLLDRCFEGFGMFHFHFQEINNGALAGPGVGDMEFVKANGGHAVVITSVGEGKFDVDYYTASGAVVDLGVFTVSGS